MSFPGDVPVHIRYAALLAATSDAVLLTDDVGRTVEVNAAAERLFDRSAVDIVGRMPVELVDFPLEQQHEILAVTRSGGQWAGEVSVVRPDGSTRISEALVQGMFVDGRFVGTIGVNRDVTEQRRLGAALVEAEQRWRLTLDHAPAGIALVSLDGHLLRVNDALCQMLGYSENELTGVLFQDLTHPDDLSEDLGLLRRLIDGEVPHYDLEKRYRHAGGHAVWGHLSVGLVSDTEGQPLHLVAQVQDVTNRRIDRNRLERLARTDAVTGLLNRRAFMEALHGLAQNADGLLAVGFLDLDGFKQLNDEYGHAAGDALLRVVARRLESLLRSEDAAGRYGGDEFALALGNVPNREALPALASRLLESIAAPYRLNELTIRMTGSLGMAVADRAVTEFDPYALLSQADHAMYRAKAAGKNGFVIL